MELPVVNRDMCQRLPPNNKGADEGSCASNSSMTQQLNAVNYLRLGREVYDLPLPFFLRCGLGGLVRNNCTVSTYPGGSGMGGEAFASIWVQSIDPSDLATLFRPFPKHLHHGLRPLS